jgi:CheY-like chemotaxis protein/predicted  nucleic acid-binding Zn-ribbon protein
MAGETILILETDANFSKALRLYFRGTDFDLEFVTDGGEALEAGASKPPGLILMTLDAEGFDAFDVFAQFKEEPSTADIPILVMSAKMSEPEIQEDGRVGTRYAAYLKKPFVKKALLGLIEQKMAAGPRPAAKAAAAGAPKKGKAGGDVDISNILTEIDEEIDDFFDRTDKTGASGEAPGAKSGIEVEVEEEEAQQEPETPRVDTVKIMEEPGKYAGKIRQMEEEIRSLNRAKIMLEKEIQRKEETYQDRTRALEKKIEDYEDDSKKRKSLLTQMTDSIRSLNDELEEKEKKFKTDRDTLETDKHKVEQQLANLSEKLDEKTMELEDRKDQITRLEAQLEETRVALSSTENARSETEGRLQKSQEEARNLQESLKAEQASLKEEKDKSDTLSRDLESLRARFESFLAAIQDAKSAVESAIKDHSPQ